MTCKERNVDKVYKGETGHSARIRGAEHLRELEMNKDKSVLLKHKTSEHNSENVIFQYRTNILSQRIWPFSRITAVNRRSNLESSFANVMNVPKPIMQ